MTASRAAEGPFVTASDSTREQRGRNAFDRIAVGTERLLRRQSSGAYREHVARLRCQMAGQSSRPLCGGASKH